MLLALATALLGESDGDTLSGRRRFPYFSCVRVRGIPVPVFGSAT